MYSPSMRESGSTWEKDIDGEPFGFVLSLWVICGVLTQMAAATVLKHLSYLRLFELRKRLRYLVMRMY